MTEPRLAVIFRSAVSLVGALALVVGVPLLLATGVGWPLPSAIPRFDAIEQAARSGVSDEVVVNTLAVIAWIAWAQLALALIVEAIAVARDRTSVGEGKSVSVRLSSGGRLHLQ